MDFTAIKHESKNEMGYNPASVDMATGELILNKDVFYKKSKFTQKFIKEHERGHLLLDTDNEELADEYALSKLYKTEKKSLKKSIKALTEFLPDDDRRIANLYEEALKLDKKNNFMGNINIRTLMNGQRHITTRRNADGNADYPPLDGKKPAQRFVDVGGYAFTIFEIIVGVMTLILFVKKMK